MTSRSDVRAAEQHGQAIEAERDAAVRRRAVGERVEQEAELARAPRSSLDAEQREDALPAGRAVDTDAAAAELGAVQTTS